MLFRSAKKIIDYPWYGNIRELEHAIEKAIIISDGDKLQADYFNLSCKMQTNGGQNVEMGTLEDMEKQMIVDAIDQCNSNLSAVARQLGITRQTHYNKVRELGI